MKKHTQKMVQQALLALAHVAEEEAPGAIKYLIVKLEEKLEKKLKVVK
jgi:hypothetical protein